MNARVGLLALSMLLTAAQQVPPGVNNFLDDQVERRTPNGLAASPPMGWNSWNAFGCEVDEAKVRAAADTLVASGMREAGYQYVVIDDCWQGTRDANGFIQASPERFPSGIKALADYVHDRGLKFGLYSDAGAMTCGKKPGSQGHEHQDALTYARWGIDYLKYDWCWSGKRNAEEAYTTMADALAAAGRPIVLSICEWGYHQPWTWAANVGNLWRTTGDITNKWNGRHGPYKTDLGVLTIVDLNERLWPFAGLGHWNDPDMLEVGNGGLTDEEARSHFSLWAMMAAPLMAGNDLGRMATATRAILTNREVIAVDQDRLGRQGRRVRKDGDQEVWVKPLAEGRRAVLLLNRGQATARIAFGAPDLDMASDARFGVRDLWLGRDVGYRSGGLALDVPPHGVRMLVVRP